MKPYIITAAASSALTVVKAKEHLEVDHTVNDAVLIPDLIAAAEKAWEEDTGRVLLDSTWEQSFDAWPCEYFELLRYPVTSIVSIKYTRSDGTEQTMSSSLYTLYAKQYRKPRVYLNYAQTWPSETLATGPAIRVRFEAGEADADDIPSDIMSAIKIRIGDLYMDRDGQAEMRSRQGQLVGSERMWRLATKRHGIER